MRSIGFIIKIILSKLQGDYNQLIMSARKKITIFVICFLSLIGLAQARPSFFPRGCEVKGFGYNEDYLILNENGEQTFYLIQNRSTKQIEIEHHELEEEVFMSPKLESKISPNRWSAFASDVKNMYFNCFFIEKNERVQTKCSEVLEVCQYPRVRFALSNSGNYWVSTNKSQNQVVSESIKKGIFLRW